MYFVVRFSKLEKTIKTEKHEKFITLMSQRTQMTIELYCNLK